jgi:hypothetical protein
LQRERRRCGEVLVPTCECVCFGLATTNDVTLLFHSIFLHSIFLHSPLLQLCLFSLLAAWARPSLRATPAGTYGGSWKKAAIGKRKAPAPAAVVTAAAVAGSGWTARTLGRRASTSTRQPISRRYRPLPQPPSCLEVRLLPAAAAELVTMDAPSTFPRYSHVWLLSAVTSTQLEVQLQLQLHV